MKCYIISKFILGWLCELFFVNCEKFNDFQITKTNANMLNFILNDKHFSVLFLDNEVRLKTTESLYANDKQILEFSLDISEEKTNISCLTVQTFINSHLSYIPF